MPRRAASFAARCRQHGAGAGSTDAPSIIRERTLALAGDGPRMGTLPAALGRIRLASSSVLLSNAKDLKAKPVGIDVLQEDASSTCLATRGP